MEQSIAHKHDMNGFGQEMFPDLLVPWEDAVPPDLESADERRTTGRLKHCAYCGSMHPADVAEAIRAGAQGSWADRKYGWPHKAYFHDIPNPHAGMLEVRASGNYKAGEDWIQTGDRSWHEPGRPAGITTWGKFYSVHLMDAEPEDRKTIEEHLGLTFVFTDDGQVAWWKVPREVE